MAKATRTVEEPSLESISIPINFFHEKFKWYAVIVQSGMEKKCKLTLEERIKKFKLDDSFGHILIPQMIVERVDATGKKKKVEQRIMPGYVFVQIDPNQKNCFSFVIDTPKITKFVSTQANQDPVPVPNEEVDRLCNKAAEVTKTVPSRALAAFEKGDKVRVIDGPFTNFTGEIDEVKPEKMKLRVLISVFGRATPVEVEFSKVEKFKE